MNIYGFFLFLKEEKWVLTSMINKVQMSIAMKENILLSHHTPNNTFFISKVKIIE